LGLLLALGFTLLACATSLEPHAELAEILKHYRALPEQRALAISGEIRRHHWVAGASGGHASLSEAEAEALRECRKHRVKRRMQMPCRLYAVGDEVVWTGP
jgi:hypothetical protein